MIPAAAAAVWQWAERIAAHLKLVLLVGRTRPAAYSGIAAHWRFAQAAVIPAYAQRSNGKLHHPAQA